MKTYELVIHIEADGDMTAEQIRNELYAAAEDVPFGFSVKKINEIPEGQF